MRQGMTLGSVRKADNERYVPAENLLSAGQLLRVTAASFVGGDLLMAHRGWY